MGDARLARESVEVLVKSLGSARLARESNEVLVKSLGSATLARESVEVLYKQLPDSPTTIQFRSKATTYLDPAGTSIDVAMPAGVQPGDGLLLFIHYTGSSVSITPPAGWTRAVYFDNVAPTTGGSLAHSSRSASNIFWRVATGTETATYNFVISVAGRISATVIAYSGTSPTSFLGNIQTIDTVNTAALTTLPLLQNVNNGWLFNAIGSVAPSDGGSYSINDSSDVERFDDVPTATSGSRPYTALYDSNRTIPAGYSSSRIMTLSVTPQINAQSAWSVELVSNAVTGAGPITFVGATTTAQANDTVTATAPAGTLPGDVLIAVCMYTNSTQSGMNYPAGWSRIQKIVSNGVNNCVSINYRVVTKSEPAYVFDNQNNAFPVRVYLAAYRGVNTSSPIGAFSIDVPGTTAAAQTLPSLTATTTGSWLIYGMSGTTNARTATTSDASDAERVDAAATNQSAYLYDSNRPYNAGATMTGRTITQSGTNSTPLTFAFELKPGAAYPPVSSIPADFTDSAWRVYGTTPVTPTRIVMDSSFDGIETVGLYNLKGSRVFWKFAKLPDGDLYGDLTNFDIGFSVYLTQGWISAQDGIHAYTWDASKPYLSIRESGGTIYYERSATGQTGTWELLYSELYSGPMGNLQLSFFPGSITTEAWVDNVNTPATTKTVSFQNESGAWVSTKDKEIKMYDGTSWQSISHPTASDIKIYDGTAWVSIKP